MNIVKICAVAAIVLLLAACGGKEEKKAEEPIIASIKAERPAPREPIAMQDYSDRTDVEWLSKSYTIVISRKADTSLPIVKDGEEEYVDNTITLRVMRSDGSTAIEKTFTKSTFTSYLTKAYREGGILEGLVLDKVEGSTLLFAASVTLPESDEFMPLKVAISRTGEMSITHDDYLE